MKGVILAGGKGTRMRPLTYITPKPMLPLVTKPFMEYFILRLKHFGINEIILSTGYLPDVFNTYFGNGKKFGVNIIYVTEEQPLGTCGAVKNVEKYIGNETFLVFNGDILTSLNLKNMISFHKSKKADITISLSPVEDPTSYGLVPIDKNGKVKDFLEKPSMEEINTNLINAGTYIIEPHILGHVPEGENYSFERELFPKVLKLGYKIFGYASNDYWLDVGTPEKYMTAHYDILDRKVAFNFAYKKVYPNVYIGADTKYSKDNITIGPIVIGEKTTLEDDVKIMPNSVVGNNCKIMKGSSVSESIIFDNCTIGKDCIIRNAIIAHNVKVGNNVKVEGNSIVGDNSKLGDNNILKNGIRINVNSEIKEEQISF
ncbi:MAG: NDP-sugar synthase [Actinobacteria bacterium]|nr:NDP-sugar synthase [Actinomycetota bacterium]